MSSADVDESYKAYQEDPRIPCKYGIKCYQKNLVHHQKYKHPPKKDTKKQRVTKRAATGKKRKNGEDSSDSKEPANSPEKKLQKFSHDISDEEPEDTPSKSDSNDSKDIEASSKDQEETAKNDSSSKESNKDDTSNAVTVLSLLNDHSINTQNEPLSIDNIRKVISELFLTDMPEDFYQFYDLCKSISPDDPLNAFKDVSVKPVGPYDAFSKNFLHSKVESKKAFLRHWRYYYDPPEFQTILRVEGKSGLHFGYWRDDPSEKPVFVAKNEASVSCIIEPVAENVFGTVDSYLEEKVKLANPFGKPRIMRLQQQLKTYAKDKGITLERRTMGMQKRAKKIVAKTLHKAGIVVPYDKKTELGYRDLAVTEKELQKILKQIEEAGTTEERKVPMSKLEEVVRLANIAADECDFGTCLELGHDLFSSGVVHVQKTALHMLSTAYSLLQRSQFLEIFKAHLEDRRKGSNLSVL